MATFTQRIIGAAKLDVSTYEEVEADRTAMGQAIGIVVLSSIAAGIGGLSRGSEGLLGGALAALVGWFLWAFVTYIVGTRILPEPQTRADLGELLRTTGFSASPGLLRVLGIVPLVGGLVQLLTTIWMLAAFVVAVRQALDYRSTGRAIGVCVIGWVFFIAVQLVIWMFLGMPGRGGV